MVGGATPGRVVLEDIGKISECEPGKQVSKECSFMVSASIPASRVLPRVLALISPS